MSQSLRDRISKSMAGYHRPEGFDEKLEEHRSVNLYFSHDGKTTRAIFPDGTKFDLERIGTDV